MGKLNQHTMYKIRISSWFRILCAMIVGTQLMSACSSPATSNDLQNSLVTGSEDFDFGYVEKESVTCEGVYPHHLQGISLDNQGNLFWSFTTELVKTDKNGKVLQSVKVAFHHGDLSVVDGKVFVAVGFGKWNHIEGLADSWVYVYNADDLQELQRFPVREVVYGAGGIAHRNNKFYVVGGLPETVDENYIYEYDENFSFLRRHTLETGHTHLGIQTIDYHNGEWWLGTYGTSKLLILEEDFSVTSKYPMDISLGIASVSRDEIMIGKNIKQGNGFVGIATRFVKSER